MFKFSILMFIGGQKEDMLWKFLFPRLEVLEYWIPGRKTLVPSMPVPFDGSTDVQVDASLMFLTGSSAASHEFVNLV